MKSRVRDFGRDEKSDRKSALRTDYRKKRRKTKVNFKKGTLPILLVLAMLIVAFAALFPATVSAEVTPAEDGEIADYRYQTVIGADVKTSEDTDLRFLFSIDEAKLNDYTAVGIAFSKSDDDPEKVDSPTQNYVCVTKVYRSVVANGTPIPAPDGRYWAAIKLSDIPHASFATEIYVRPFVEDGEGTRYGETKHINVCEALGHTHEASLLCPHCDGCNLDVDSPKVVVVNNADATDIILQASYEDEILAGGKHFYPDESNGFEGNDLYVEFSILWNQAFADNCKGTLWSGNAKSEGASSVKWAWMTMNNGGDGRSDCRYAGGFEGCDLGTIEYPAGVSMVGSGSAFDQFPNLAGADSANPEYGWHRVTFKLHQEVTNVAALEADATAGATAAQYKLTGTYYIDGVKLAQLSYSGIGNSSWGAPGKSGSKTNLDSMYKGLFSARSDGNGNVVYKDLFELNTVAGSKHATHAFIGFIGVVANDPEVPGYIVYGDVSFTCGTDPVQSVERAADPTVATIAPVGYGLPTNVYYQFKND